MAAGEHSHLKLPARAGDTIAGISAPPGGALSLLRLSGPSAVAVAERIFRGRLCARRATLGHLADADRGRTVDEAVATLYAAPHSYTREDLVEISLRGGPALAAHALHLALRAGARAAAPGDFTRRAVEHGRIDLLQAAGALAMMRSVDPQELHGAAELVEGRASARLRQAEAGIARALQQLEAASDDRLEESMDASVEDLATGLRGVADSLAALTRRALGGVLDSEDAIGSAIEQVRRAIDGVDDGLPADAVMEALLAARAALGRLSASGATAQDLDAFFARFPPGS